MYILKGRVVTFLDNTRLKMRTGKINKTLFISGSDDTDFYWNERHLAGRGDGNLAYSQHCL